MSLFFKRRNKEISEKQETNIPVFTEMEVANMKMPQNSIVATPIPDVERMESNLNDLCEKITKIENENIHCIIEFENTIKRSIQWLDRIKRVEKDHREMSKKKDDLYKSIIEQKDKMLAQERADRKEEVHKVERLKNERIRRLEEERHEINKMREPLVRHKETIDKLQKEIDYQRKEIKDHEAQINELKVALNAEKEKTQRGNDNVVFADELKPYADKILTLMDMGNRLQAQCNNIYMRGKDNTNAASLLNNAFAKFQSATINLKVGNWHEQLNALVYNGTLIKPPAGKENNHSSVYATIHKAIEEGKNTQERAAEFQKATAIAFLNRYCSALLVLIEDMQILFKSVSLQPNIDIQNLRDAFRIHIKKELGLEINDVLLLASSQNNSGIQIMAKVPTDLVKEENRIIEILSYGIGSKGAGVEKTKVIISK